MKNRLFHWGKALKEGFFHWELMPGLMLFSLFNPVSSCSGMSLEMGQ